MIKKRGVINIESLKDKNVASVLLLNLSLSVFQFFYTYMRFEYLNPQIPFWYTMPWGDAILAPKYYIFALPAITLLLIIGSVGIINRLFVIKNKDGVFTTLTFLTISTFFLYIAEARIISKASTPFEEIISGRVLQLLPLVFVAFVGCALIVPFVIKLARKYDIVTDPVVHTHPGMILKQPSARAGAVAFFVSFLTVSLITVPLSRPVIGIYVGAFLTTLIGLSDDLRSLNPYLRLLILLPIAVLVTILLSDSRILFFASPVDGIVRIDQISAQLDILGRQIRLIPIADLFTIVWVLWVMNMLSWSNAVDGQYSGMTAITCIVVAVLSLRLIKIDPFQINIAKLAAISAGASLGILPFNWHPSKIMWGFGATTMGLLIAMLSIMAGTKVAAATLVLIVPTLDAIITIVRRVLEHRSPVWGDRGHLHHRLLDMGFSQQEVAIFYWVLTSAFGFVALISSGREKFLALMTLGGLVAFILVVINLKGALGKPKQPQLEK